MGGVIGDTLPLGVGIALNPIAIVVGILLLAAARSPRNGVAFAIGWISGLTLLLLLVSVLVERWVTADPVNAPRLLAACKVIAGVFLIAFSVRELWDSTRRGQKVSPPKWMEFIAVAGMGRSAVMGLFLSVVSLKNLILMAAAASVIGQAGLGIRGIVVAVGIFVAICSIGVLIPLLLQLFGGERAANFLDNWGTWLEANVGTITAVVMVLMGANLVGKGISGLF